MDLLKNKGGHLPAAKDDQLSRAAIIHKLKSPLSEVIGFLELGLERWNQLSETEKRDYFVRANDAAHDVLRVIQNDLEVIRSEFQLWDTHPKQDKELLAFINAQLLPLSKNVPNLLSEVRGPNLNELPSGVFDRAAVSIILHHLVENASQFGELDRPIVVSLKHESGLFISLLVSSWDKLHILSNFDDDIFKAFTSSQGTGLGLYVARNYARSMGGDVTVSQQLIQDIDVLTTFELTIPSVEKN